MYENFSDRHCGLTQADVASMLAVLGFDELEDLLVAAVPENIYEPRAADIGVSWSEQESLRRLNEIAKKNKICTSMIGLGYYDCLMPPVIKRVLLESPSWYTAYTPYQPEISQGRLEMLVNFQTMVCDLTGLPMANASLLDEATAAAEAMVMLKRARRGKTGNRFFVDETLFPQTVAVLQTRAKALNIALTVGDVRQLETATAEDYYGAIVGYPNGHGEIRDLPAIVDTLEKIDTPLVCVCDLMALALLKPPGEIGAPIVVGSTQRFGVPLGCGGPHAAFIAFTKEYSRLVPGRIIGLSRDRHNRIAYRLALQTREQHIRREKATSNICTAQAFPAMLAACYAIYHGADGIRRIATRINKFAKIFAIGCREKGIDVLYDHFFDTVFIRTAEAASLAQKIAGNGVNVRLVDEVTIGVSCDEKTTQRHIDILWRCLFGHFAPDAASIALPTESSIPAHLQRSSQYLQHDVFRIYRSEHEMLRYLRNLANYDIALDRSMIPLGSCTMKLNAAAEMTALSWASFSDIHPFAPDDQKQGYWQLTGELEQLLATLSGFDAISLQPNAGAQGEYAGLIAIRSYHEANNEESRQICLIPKSAHGTNPSSATLAGMEVVDVEVGDDGEIDIADLKNKCDQHGERIGALMITYPSTSGTYVQTIREICDIVHQTGAQVYMDGANFNALVGVARPGQFGADVMHFNLHKTFCIPHGGGGPGMGPIGVRKHLATHLPSHPFLSRTGSGAISAAPWGSASILLISWMYIRMMGTEGLRQATAHAVLSANYVAKKISDYYPIAHQGANGCVAHECIVDTRQLKKTANVTVEDIAKRLMDYGLHAPTISWPIPGAMMIEPTESESLRAIDQYCESLISIRGEIERIEQGQLPTDDNPLINAPHTADVLLDDQWDHAYSRTEAAFPVAWLKQNKYWPPVSRVDQVWGDRHLICTRQSADFTFEPPDAPSD